MILPPPRSTLTDTLFPYTTLFRSIASGILTGLDAYHQNFDLPLDRIKHTIRPHWYRNAPDGMDEAAFAQHCAQKLEELILAEGPDTVAAFIGEPVLGKIGRAHV